MIKTAGSNFDSLGTKLKSSVSNVKDGLSQLQQSVANTKLSFSHNIKLPHFYMGGGFNLETGAVPYVGVNWYDKGGIFENQRLSVSVKNGLSLSAPWMICARSCVKKPIRQM